MPTVTRANAAAAALLVAGCWSLTATTSDLTGGGAASPSPSAAEPDAAAVADGGTTPAEKTDAGPTTTTRFCEGLTPRPSFCDDFDAKPELAAWSEPILNAPGSATVRVDTSASLSPAGSLLTRLDAHGSGSEGCGYAAAVQDLQGSFATTVLTYAIRVDTATGCNGVPSVVGLRKDGANMCLSLVVIGPNEVTSFEQVYVDGVRSELGHTGIHDYVKPPDGWLRIRHEVDWLARSTRVTIGERVAVSDTTPACPHAPSNARLQLGIHCQPDHVEACEQRYDDVTLNVAP